MQSRIRDKQALRRNRQVFDNPELARAFAFTAKYANLDRTVYKRQRGDRKWFFRIDRVEHPALVVYRVLVTKPSPFVLDHYPTRRMVNLNLVLRRSPGHTEDRCPSQKNDCY